MPASYVYSSCNPVTTGCYLYTDPCLGTAASNGYYSDGTNCFTVTSGGYVSSVYNINVYININGPSSADGSGETGSGNVQVVSQNTTSYFSNSNFVNVTSTLTIEAVCYGATNTVYDTNTILNGNHCSTDFLFTGLDSNETIDGYGIVSISPTSDSSYIYNIGVGFRDSTYTC
jgi:hypothetical protein